MAEYELDGGYGTREGMVGNPAKGKPGNPWYHHLKEWAAANGVPYHLAVKDPLARQDYYTLRGKAVPPKRIKKPKQPRPVLQMVPAPAPARGWQKRPQQARPQPVQAAAPRQWQKKSRPQVKRESKRAYAPELPPLPEEGFEELPPPLPKSRPPPMPQVKEEKVLEFPEEEEQYGPPIPDELPFFGEPEEEDEGPEDLAFQTSSKKQRLRQQTPDLSKMQRAQQLAQQRQKQARKAQKNKRKLQAQQPEEMAEGSGLYQSWVDAG